MPKTVFIHGRPYPHSFHAALAQSIAADFLPVDFRMRWHDRPTSRPYRYLSWAVCALSFPNRKQYDLFLTEGPHFPPLLLKRLGMLGPRQSVAALMDNETLYFLRAERYPKRTQRALLSALGMYDALICVGSFQERLAQELLSGQGRMPGILKVTSGYPAGRADSLGEVTPALEGRQMVFIADGADGWRGWYKGLDLLLDTFAHLSPGLDGSSLKIVGRWNEEYIGSLRQASREPSDRVQFLGHQSDLTKVLSESALYVHLARGEAFGISILEAMLAGVPALVSEWTGAREAVEQVDRRLVVPADPTVAADRISWYFSLSSTEKTHLSARSREVASTYTEETARREFRELIMRNFVN
jgi:glycosyltransferase involved in cell wall biosynthesis